MSEEEVEAIVIMEKEIPQDILMEILSWLPANSLVSSFKFVCKDWCTVIKDPDFIKMHLNRRRRASINGGGGGGGSLIRKRARTGINMDRSIIGNTLFQLKPPFNYEGFVIEPRTKLDVDCDLISSRSRLVGSCNGLLCLSDSPNEILLDQGIILLNPSTRKCKISPKKPIERPHKPATYGFGCYYNSTTNIDEYKVVRIVHFYTDMEWQAEPQSFQLQIDIYSMSSNSWRILRRVEGIPCDISQERFGLFLNGAVHWMGCKLQQGDVWYWDTIVSFNIRDEEFRQVPMPPCADVVNDNAEYPYLNDYTILMNVRGYLGNAYFSRTKMMDTELEIWVMKEYGIGESWTKEFVIKTSDSEPLRELSGSYMFSSYKTCFLTGDKILIEVRVCAGHGSCNTLPYTIPPLKDFGRRVLYDMNKKEIDGDFVMIDMPYEHYSWDDQVDYIETLVSLKSSLLPSSNN